jgi:phage-related protein
MSQTSIFRWPFSIESGFSAKTRTRTIQFGDGYEQEGPDGLTGPLKTWRILCDDLEGYEASEIEEYLDFHMRTGTRINARHPDTGAMLMLSVDGYSWRGKSGLLRSIEIEAHEVKEWP